MLQIGLALLFCISCLPWLDGVVILVLVTRDCWCLWSFDLNTITHDILLVSLTAETSTKTATESLTGFERAIS